jgi:hypothetical protein
VIISIALIGDINAMLEGVIAGEVGKNLKR